MPIKVLVPTIDYDSVIIYYNIHKNENDQPLERLDRAEGGFQIKKNEEIDSFNSNDKIRQLRWSRKCLVSHYPYDSFTKLEELLLFQSIKSVLGDNVIYECSNPDDIKFFTTAC